MNPTLTGRSAWLAEQGHGSATQQCGWPLPNVHPGTEVETSAAHSGQGRVRAAPTVLARPARRRVQRAPALAETLHVAGG